MIRSSNKTYRLITWIFVVLNGLTTSCNHQISPQTPARLYDRYKQCVVLILNEYYYEVTLSNGKTAYFTEFNNREITDLTFDEDSAQKKAHAIYGTGFFISRKGILATNRHVVAPEIDEVTLLASLRKKFINLKIQNLAYYQELTHRMTEIDNQNSKNHRGFEDSSRQREKAILDQQRNILLEANLPYDFDAAASSIKSKSGFLGIAYANTILHDRSDFKECVLIKKSGDPNIDLALIQLKNKNIPENIESVFDFEEHNPNIKNGRLEKGKVSDSANSLLLDTRVYMIGFNYGLEAANTTQGLKAQLTEGKITQETDEYKVLYSIPSLQGSSGSPVIDEWGNLLAINYAKINNSENFSYGITANHLKKLLKE